MYFGERDDRKTLTKIDERYLCAVLLNSARPGGSIRDPVDPGPGPGRATQKTGGRKKTARPGLTRVTRTGPGDPA